MDRRHVELPRVRVQVLQHAEPHRGDAGSDGDFFLHEQIDDARGIEVRPGHHHLRAEHDGGKGESPCVGVEHRHNGKNRVALLDVHARRQGEAEGMQHDGAMRVEDAFRFAGGAGRVAHRRRVELVRLRQVHRGRGLREERFVFEIAGGHRFRGADDDHCLDGGDERLQLLPERQKRFVDDHHRIAGVVDDVGELVVVEAEVERVEDAAHERDGEIGLEVCAVVPGESGDAVARSDAEVDQDAREAAGAIGEVAHGVAVNRLVGEA